MSAHTWTYRRLIYFDPCPDAFRELPDDPWDGWFDGGEVATAEAAAFFAQAVGEHCSREWRCPDRVDVEVHHPSGKIWRVNLKIELSVEVDVVWNGEVHECAP